MLEVKDLRKTYGDLTAVNGINFTLSPGDVFGFIGSNGAGKTTTIKMIATLIEPTSGTAIINGYDILRQQIEVRNQVGYMPDFFGLYDDLRVWEYLDFFANIYGVPAKQRAGIIDNVLELTDLMVKKEAFVQSLSRGMQQRLCLARCLVHDPMLLLLDEPASGLDPRARAELKDLIIELGKRGKIVVVSSHILPELADFCNTIGIIEKGNMLALGPVDQVVKAGRTHRSIRVKLLTSSSDAEGFLGKQSSVTEVKVTSPTEVLLGFDGALEDQARLLEELIGNDHRVVDFREEHVDLEDLFLSITTGAVQ